MSRQNKPDQKKSSPEVSGIISGEGCYCFIRNFFEIPYETITLREDAHAAVRKMSPNGDQRRRAKSAGLPSGMRGWGSRSPLADFVL